MEIMERSNDQKQEEIFLVWVINCMLCWFLIPIDLGLGNFTLNFLNFLLSKQDDSKFTNCIIKVFTQYKILVWIWHLKAVSKTKVNLIHFLIYLTEIKCLNHKNRPMNHIKFNINYEVAIIQHCCKNVIYMSNLSLLWKYSNFSLTQDSWWPEISFTTN